MSKSRKLIAARRAGMVLCMLLAAGLADRTSGKMWSGSGDGTGEPAGWFAAHADEKTGFGLGRPALPEEVAAWDIDIRPDGTGLPQGSGDVWTGEDIYVDQCATCHGDFGEGIDRWPVLAGGQGSLTDDRPTKTVGSYWPYLSTVWDYVNRAMPFGNAQSLSPDEVYALTAYILYLNDVVGDDFELSGDNFADVRLPNQEQFYLDDRAETELATFSVEPCMQNCKSDVQITARAAVVDVTPEETAAAGQGAERDVAEVAAVAVVAEPPAADPALIAAGEQAFRQCSACHLVGEGAVNRVGPHLNGVFGRTAGTMDGFRYSRGFVEAGQGGLVWDQDTLHDFLTQPRRYIRGTRMSFNGFRNEDDIAAVIAYLRSQSE